MTDHRHSSHDASFAADRLREVLDSMRDIWSKSLEETENRNNPIDLYVVDADVVLMFMRPAKLHNYGALLRYEGHARSGTEPDLKNLETRVVEFLGNLIFFQLQSGIPLLLLPDHADDLARIMSKVWEAANTELGNWEKTRVAIKSSTSNVTETSKRQLSSASDVVDDRNVSEKQRPQTIEGLLEEIFRSMRGEGDVGSLFRFDALGSSDRLCHLDRIELRDEKGQQRFFPPPLNAAGEYVAPVSHLAKRLFPMMTRLSGASDPSRRFWIQRDAQALAHLAWLNELLAKDFWYIKTGEGVMRRVGRLVLITGSHLIPQAISELELKSLQGCVFAPLSFLGHRLMDEYFQRDHGRQHTTMEDSTQGSQASALINFLDSMRGLLDSAIKSGNSGEISRALAEVRGKHSDMAESWQGRQLFGPHSRMKAISSAIEELENSGKSLGGLEEFLETLSVEAWQSFARSVTKLNLKTAAPNQVVQRNIPPVLFKHFPTAQKISDELYQTGDNAAARDHATEVVTGSSIRKLKKDDPSHYTEFVCYALFGLVHRTLRSAEGCAEIALSIAESEPTEGKYAKFIKGDEALYLLAHIIRLRARRKEHLDRAETCIDLAMKAARQSREAEEVEPVDDIRLESERFSIHCHQRYFECLGNVGRIHPMLRTSRNENQLLSTFDEGVSLLNKIQAPESKDKSGYVYEYVQQQLLVNLAQLGLLCVFPALRKGDESVEAYIPIKENSAIEKYHPNFNDVTQRLVSQCEKLHADRSGKLPKSSTLSTCVAIVAGARFLGHREIDESFSPKHGKVASIDGLRFKYLESVLNYLGRNAGAVRAEDQEQSVIGNKQPISAASATARTSSKQAPSKLHVHLKQ